MKHWVISHLLGLQYCLSITSRKVVIEFRLLSQVGQSCPTFEHFQYDGHQSTEWISAICIFRCIPWSERMCFWMGTRSPGTWTERLGLCFVPLPRQEHSMGVWFQFCQVLSHLRVLIKTTQRQHHQGKESMINSTRRIEWESSTTKKKKKKKTKPWKTILCCKLLPDISSTLTLVPFSQWWTGSEKSSGELWDCRRLTVLPTKILICSYHHYIHLWPSCSPQLFWWVSA